MYIKKFSIKNFRSFDEIVYNLLLENGREMYLISILKFITKLRLILKCHLRLKMEFELEIRQFIEQYEKCLRIVW